MSTLVSSLHEVTKRSDAQYALVYEGTRLTFGQLDALSSRLAESLVQRGIKRGDRVAILDMNSHWFFVVLFAVVKCRAVLVPINFRLAPPEIAFILKDSTANCLFIGAAFKEQLAEIDVGGFRVIGIDSLGENLTAVEADQPLDEHAQPEDAAVQMYTSGTTGLPKGVVLSHRAMVNAADRGNALWEFLSDPGGSVLATMPLFHIAACNLGLAALFQGARVDIVNQADPAFVARWLSDHQISLVPLPATVIHGMLELEDIHERDFSALKTMLVAGSGIAESLIKRATDCFNCGLALSYGSTETCGGITYLGPTECVQGAGERLKSAGKVMSPARIEIRRPDNTICDPGEIGEIICFSDRLMDEYWRRPEDTEKVLTKDGYKSGDAGYLDEEGYLFVVDRLKDMVISGGENIYPVEIESVLYQHPDVLDAAVIGVPDVKWGEALLCILVLRESASLESESMIEFLRSKIAGYKIPRRYVQIDALPRNASGKVVKPVLRERFG